MGITRITEEGLQKRREEMARLRREIGEHEAIAKERDSPLWQRLGSGIKAAIEANREKMEELLSRESTITDRNGNMIAVDPVADLASAKALAGAIKFGKLILEQVEVDGVIEAKRSRVSNIAAEIEKAIQEQNI